MRQDRFPAEPAGQIAKSAPSLADALDVLFPELGTPTDLPGNLAKFLSDLTAANNVTLLAKAADGPIVSHVGSPPDEIAIRKLAGKAASIKGVYSEASWLAVALKSSEATVMLAVLDLSGANRLAVAMASERLEMVRVLCRTAASAQQFRPSGEFIALALRLASRDWQDAQRFTDILAQSSGQPDLAFARVEAGQAREIWFAGQADVSHRSTLRQTQMERVQAALISPASDPTVCLLGHGPDAAVVTSREKPLPEGMLGTLKAVFTPPQKQRMWGRSLRRVALAMAACAAVVGILLIPIPDTINLPARIEATHHRVVTVPFDGRIDEILVSDGDSVIAGETLLGSMDTVDVDRKLTELRTQIASAISKRDAARGQRNAAEVREAELNLELLSVRIEAAEAERAAASLLAPIDGYVQIKSDTDMVGSFAGLGTSLMEIVDPTQKRVVLDVTPRARGGLSIGDTGHFSPDASPIDTVSFQLGSVGYLAKNSDMNVHVGRSETLNGADATALLIDMQGVASMQLGEQRIGMLLWKRVRDWAVVTFWL